MTFSIGDKVRLKVVPVSLYGRTGNGEVVKVHPSGEGVYVRGIFFDGPFEEVLLFDNEDLELVCSPTPVPRKNGGKPKLTHVLRFPNAIAGASQIMEDGINKYGDKEGWRYYSPPEVLDSMLRHQTKLLSGEHFDKESGRHHAFHILANALILAEIMVPKNDDKDHHKDDPQVVETEGGAHD